MDGNTEQYQGLEREQTFVRKFDDLLWTYCRYRFAKRWMGTNRSVPQAFRHDGEEGWFFPKQWLRDFMDERGHVVRSPIPKPDIASRIGVVDRATAGLASRKRPQCSSREAETWELPAGTVVSAKGVQYPDGTFEALDDIRLRKGQFLPGARARNEKQQNLEDMLRQLRRRREEEITEGTVSEALASSNLARSDWIGDS